MFHLWVPCLVRCLIVLSFNGFDEKSLGSIFLAKTKSLLLLNAIDLTNDVLSVVCE